MPAQIEQMLREYRLHSMKSSHGLLENAREILQSDPEHTLHTYNQLVETRDQAQGDEASQIGALVEEFILEASMPVVMEISKVKKRTVPSGWATKHFS